MICFSVFTYSCSYVQVAWIQRLMAITYWPMQKVRILSGFSHRCCQRKVRYNAAVVSGRYGTTPLLSAEGLPPIDYTIPNKPRVEVVIKEWSNRQTPSLNLV